MKRLFPMLLIIICACTLFNDGREAGTELMPLSMTKWVFIITENDSDTYEDVDTVVTEILSTSEDEPGNDVSVLKRTAFYANGSVKWAVDLYWRNDSTGFYNYLNGLALDAVPYLRYPVTKGKTWVISYDYCLFNYYDSLHVQVKGVENYGEFGECWVVEKHFISTYYDTYPQYIVKSWYAPDIGMVKEVTSFSDNYIVMELVRYE